MSSNEELRLMCNRLQEAMSNCNLSFGEISNRTGIPKSAVHRYISGETPKIPLDRLEKIATAMGVSAAWIMGWESPVITEDTYTFPVVGEIAAGYDSIALEEWEGDTIEVPSSYLKGRKSSEFFVLRVKGDSMYPLYQENDKVLILKQSTLNYSGQVGAILYDDEYTTLKKVEFVNGENWMRLIPINPSHPPKTIEGADLERCKVIGIPKLLIREIEG